MTQKPSEQGRHAYYDLPMDSRWLDGTSTPWQVGGRNTDITQLGYSIAQDADGFGIGTDPAVSAALLKMHRALAAAEQAIDDAFVAANAAAKTSRS